MPDRVLIVEDREHLRELLTRALERAFVVDAVADGEAALGRLAAESYAVVVTDVRLPGVDGNVVLAAARQRDPASEVVLMTAFAEVPAAVAALRAGAYDYLAKPFEPEDLARVVARAAERYALVGRTRELAAALESQESGLLGRSAPIVEVRRLLERIGPLPVPVLLCGETGTGKEVAARELHRLWGRGPFVPVTCGAIPEALLESELFGSSSPDREGLLDAARGGTLFLDEISELPLSLQARLNRALDTGEFLRPGDSVAHPVDLRLVASTHRDLSAMVADGTFRSDLYFRLKVVQIAMPPLRARRDDIPVLAARFLVLCAARFGSRARRIDAQALEALEAWHWPGNVRELRHAVEHAAVLAEDDTVELTHLPATFRVASAAAPGTYRAALERGQDAASREYFQQLLKRTGGNVTRAAHDAGVERESLHRLLRKYGIDPARFRSGGA